MSDDRPDVGVLAQAIVAAIEARSPVERLALSPAEAAESLGVSRDFFDEHIRDELRLVRRGRLRLIPLAELERWLAAEAERVPR